MSSTGTGWSDWLDLNSEIISTVPESPGVFMMHAKMKVMYIDGTDNLRKGLFEAIKRPCVSEAKRFRYMPTLSPQAIKDELINDYKKRHEGKLPECMKET